MLVSAMRSSQRPTCVSALTAAAIWDYMNLLGDPRPAVYKKVQAFMKAHPRVFGNTLVMHLPVGAAMLYQFGDSALIAAPTMILPQPVPHTHNAYFAFKMVLELLERHEYKNVLVPGLCTGIGKMDVYESVRQILCAWHDHKRGVRGNVLIHVDFVCDPAAMKEQPAYYANSLYTENLDAEAIQYQPAQTKVPRGGAIKAHYSIRTGYAYAMEQSHKLAISAMCMTRLLCDCHLRMSHVPLH